MNAALRRAVHGALYGLAVCAVAIGLTEAAVRLLGLAPPLQRQYRLYTDDPVLPYRLRPNAVIEGRAMTGEFDFRYVHNSFGLRDREPSSAKLDGTFRVLALGDSFTYGAGARFENTFLYRLERALNQRQGSHPPVEIIKAGIPRFFPEPERLFLENYGAKFEPDLVLVVFVPNDVIDTYMGLDAIQVLPDGRLVSNQGARLLAQLGAAGLWLYERFHAFRIPMHWCVQKQMQEDRPVRWDEIYRPDGFHEDAWREVEDQYGQMVRWANEHGAEIVFVHVPLPGPWEERHRYPPQRLSRWADRAGAGFVDVLPALESQDPGVPLYWPGDHHPTDAGHAVIADELFESLTRGGLIP